MDLAKLDTVAGANEGFEVQLYHPATMENLGIFVRVLGRDSDEYRRLQSEQLRRRIQKSVKTGTMRSVSSPKEIEQDGIELLAACTKGWRQAEDREGDGVVGKTTITVAGAEWECSRANAARLYTEYPWIAEQVDVAVVDRANFIRR
jgi:hypothetical protein